MHFDFEIDKENLQPLVHGRNLSMLSSVAYSRCMAGASNSEILSPIKDNEELSNDVFQSQLSPQKVSLPQPLLSILMQYLSISPDCHSIEVTDSLLELTHSFPNIPIPLTKDSLHLLFELYRDLNSSSTDDERDSLCIWLE